MVDIWKEENESMLVKVQGPIAVTRGFDTTNLGQEFEIAVLADTAYVGDDTFFPDLIGYSPVPLAGWTLDDVTGIVGYRRVNTTTPGPRKNQHIILRLEPRRDNDVNVTWSDTGDPNLDVVRAFGLRQNTPNPFNPVTTIEFAVEHPGAVQLRIYDARGQVVRTLLDREYAGAVRERVTWDGRDDAGQVVPSGRLLLQALRGQRHGHPQDAAAQVTNWGRRPPPPASPSGVAPGSGGAASRPPRFFGPLANRVVIPGWALLSLRARFAPPSGSRALRPAAGRDRPRVGARTRGTQESGES